MKGKKEISFEGGPDGHGAKPNSDNLLVPSERVIEIACGGLHTLVLTNRNRVFATGFGDTYALGLDKPQTICSFKEVNWFSQAFSYSEPIEKLSCGVAHSGCIIGGKVYLWGILGLNSQLHFKKPVLVNLPSTANNGNVSQTGNTYFKDIGGSRKGGKDSSMAIDLKLGDLLTVVLTKKGEVYTMGENTYSQLGQNKQ